MQLPSTFHPSHSVYTPLIEGGRNVVGLESDDANSVAFPPVVEVAQTAALEHPAVKSTDAPPPRAPGGVESADNAEAEGDEGFSLERALTDEELIIIRELAARDREVRNHEAAHAAVGGVLAGAPSYTYQVGPDGRKYAVGGEVSISLREVPGDPQATLANAEKVKRAALAPADPSPQDRRVAASAARMAQEARADILEQQLAPDKESGSQRPGNTAYASGTLAEPEEVPPAASINSYLQEQNSLNTSAVVDQRA